MGLREIWGILGKIHWMRGFQRCLGKGGRRVWGMVCMGSTVGREWEREIGNSGEGFNVCYCSKSGKVGLYV